MGDADAPTPSKRRNEASEPVSEFGILLALIADAEGVRMHAERVAKEGSPELRRMLAQNPHTPPSVLATLIDDPDVGTRDAAAHHIRLPFAAQELVRQRRADQERRDEARRWVEYIFDANRGAGGFAHPNRFRKVLRECDDIGVLDFLASRSFTPPATLAHLAAHADPLLREVVAANPNTPAKALEVLAGDPYGAVRLVVAENVSTPERALKRLLGDSSASVRAVVSKRLGALRE